MNETPAQAKIVMLKSSLRAFTLGVMGLVPVIGMPMALMALVCFRRACLAQRGNWNPARPFLVFGLIYGTLGIIISMLLLGFVLYLAMTGELFAR